MIVFKGNIQDAIRTFDNKLIFTLKTDFSSIEGLEDEMKSLFETEKGVKVEMSIWREKRSLNANAYCWVLLDAIAKKQRTTKEEVYKHIIKDVGSFEILSMKSEAVETFVKRWQLKGLGWLCEKVGESEKTGYTDICVYYGSSTYNSEEMSRLIDEVVVTAKDLGIQTETPDKIAELKSLWSSYCG